MPAPVSDSQLLDRFLRDADDAALAVLVARLAPLLYRVARALTAWRALGAQTVAERAWRAALARADEMEGDVGLRRVVLHELVRCAAAAGDSPRPRLAEEAPARAAAMRAVALLPVPTRTVYVLHDVAGADLAAIAEILRLPEAGVRAELWHARLAVTTLAGEADEAVEERTDDAADRETPGASRWHEPAPPELIERLVEGARHRRALAVGRRARFGLPRA